jgi:hypothetical protein
LDFGGSDAMEISSYASKLLSILMHEEEEEEGMAFYN